MEGVFIGSALYGPLLTFDRIYGPAQQHVDQIGGKALQFISQCIDGGRCFPVNLPGASASVFARGRRIRGIIGLVAIHVRMSLLA